MATFTQDDFVEVFGDSESEDDFEGFDMEEDSSDEELEGLDEVEGLDEAGVDVYSHYGEWRSVNVSGLGPRGEDEVQPDQWLPLYSSQPGPVIDFTSASEVDYFLTMFPLNVINLLVVETNRYADTYFNQCAEDNISMPDYLDDWRGVTEFEMKAFIAIIFFMGIEPKPTLKMYWSTHWLHKNEGFASIMARDRFLLILKFFHCCNNNLQVINKKAPGYDRCFKIRAMLKLLLSCWQRNYTLGQNLSIDEGMIAFKGRVGFIQYMPKKPIKYGMKAWILSDSVTAYTYNWDLYAGSGTGKKRRKNEIPLAEKVIMNLVKGLEYKGHVIYCDNFYTSTTLFYKLADLGFGACGTVRANRKGMPPDLKPVKRKHKITEKAPGPLFYRKEKLLACAWFDKRTVYVLSTVHDSSVSQKRIRAKKKDHPTGFRTVDKPLVIENYNKYMAGVDKGDQLFTYYGFHKRTLKWWKKIAFHFMEISMVNAWILYHQANPQGKTSLEFRRTVIEGLLEGYSRKPSVGGRRATDLPMRLTGRHFCTKVEGPKRPDCRVCSNRDIKKRKQTTSECADCKVYLCPVPCFKIYHTITDFSEHFEKNYR